MRLPYDVALEELHAETEVLLAAAGDGRDLFVALEPVDSSSAITVGGLPFLIALDPVDSSAAISMAYELDAQVALVPVNSTSSVVLLSSTGTGAGDGVPGSTGPLTTLSDATVSDNPPITLALVLQATLQTIPGGYPLDPEWPAELPDLSYDDTDAIPAANVTTIPAPTDTGTGTGASASPPVAPPPEGPPTMGGTTQLSTLAGMESTPVGTATYAVPSSGAVAFVAPGGSDSNDGSLAHPYATVEHAYSTLAGSGGTVVARAGTYHANFETQAGDQPVTIQAYPSEAVWLDGSVVVTDWTASGAAWVHTGVPTKFYRSGTAGWRDRGPTTKAVPTTDAAADLSDQVFLDGTPLAQLPDGQTPRAGQFSVNYSANTITIGSNPAGREVRVSDLRTLVVARSPLSLRGLGVRRYAPDGLNAVQAMAYYGGNSAGATFTDVVFAQSAMAGLSLSKPDITLDKVTFQDNTTSGLLATTCDRLNGTRVTARRNNTGKFKMAPQCGGIKITDCDQLTLDQIVVADNDGAGGLWLDVSVTRPTLSNIYALGAHEVGVNIEETDGGLLGGVQHRGVLANAWVRGPRFGLQILASGHLDVYNLRLEQCSVAYLMIQQDRPLNTGGYRTPSECPWEIRDITVANMVFGPGTPTAKTRYFDSTRNLSADALGGKLLTSQFLDTSGTLIQWGTGQNAYASYSTTGSAQAAHPASLGGNKQGAMSDADATPLPAAVAAVMGLAAGAQKLGPTLTDPTGGSGGSAVVIGPYSYLNYGWGTYGTYEPVHGKVGLPGVAYSDLADNTGPTWQMQAGGFYDLQRVRRRIDVDTTEEIIFTRSLFEGDAFLAANAGLVTALRNKQIKIKLFDCEIRPATPSIWWAGLYGHGIEAHRCWIRDVVDAADVVNPYSSDVDFGLYGCLGEDLAMFSPDPNHPDRVTHNDVVQWMGGQNLRVVGNSLRALLNPALGAAALDAAHRDPVAGGGPNNPLAVAGGANGANARYPNLQADACLQANADTGPLGQLLWQHNWHYGGGYQVNVGGDHGSQNVGSFLDNIHDPSWLYGAYALPSPTTARGLTITAALVNNRRKDNGQLAPVYTAPGNTLTPAPR